MHGDGKERDGCRALVALGAQVRGNHRRFALLFKPQNSHPPVSLGQAFAMLPFYSTLFAPLRTAMTVLA